MRTPVAINLLFFLSLSCNVTVNDDDDDGTGQDASVDDSSTNDSGTSMDMGVSMLECDPDFGQADACGGELSGTWNYRVACGSTPIAEAIMQACGTAQIQADRIEGGRGTLVVTGSSFALDVDVDVHVEASLPAACTVGGCAGTQTVLQQALAGSTVSCSAAGGGCDCTVDGPVGSASNGTVTTSGGVATVNGSETYYYCVEGNSLIYRRFGTNADEPVFVLDR